VTRSAWLVLLGILAAQPLAAQTVVRPSPPLDSAGAALRDALLVLRDSLTTIDGAAARLQRDYRETSAPALLSRARVMRDACARSIRTIPSTRDALLQASSPSDPQRLKRRQELVSALDRLKAVLSHCEAEFAAMSQPGQVERVRGYANDRAVRVQGALRKYDQTLRDFFGVMGIQVRPLGASRDPLAG
jgi:hypothetical protein